jgi:peptidoglycan/LPS O-acetylase OafA/YrhL
MRKLILNIIAAAIIIIAAVFTLYGIVQMSNFTHYSGEDFSYFNDGFGAFIMGSLALFISGILRFPLRQWIISGVAVIGLAVLGLQRFKVPAQVPG